MNLDVIPYTLRPTGEVHGPLWQHTRHEKVDIAEIIFWNPSLSIPEIK